MLSYWNDYPTIQNKLQIVCSLIEKQMRVRNKDIQETLIEFSQAGGKYLRPAFFLLFSSLGDHEKQDEKQLIQIAASIELLHMATLIHDDVIDDSPLRRGTMTVQSKYGKDIAVYTGDLLFTVFFELVIDAMNGSKFLAINARSMKRLLLGELDQMHTRYNKQETFRDYLRSVNGKTAELFWLACAEGAHFGKAAPEVERLAGRIGRSIGIAFQIYDDILDYTAEEDVLQKPVLEDLSQGIYTLPLLLAKEKHPDVFLPYLEKEQDITPEESQEVAQLVVAHEGVEMAKDIARRYTQKALTDIARLPECDARDMLQLLASQLLIRSY
ncbi:polyprenyl synthetase family protein [Candidatus Enterococcus willemsii]|uniref:Farnesyl pyrophosphate synthetase n=1 Tax=Candidatus Enterococcus willemsii TaxID=1857215 RepID=A0ABQ6YZV5_9ENTE|nr:polyprenyl synthetase family protein [Enterococcus sp. CU12B]KAF1304143.1 farnesyl pyrophosphate synthetase [Enterococcus sp. CU12B]